MEINLGNILTGELPEHQSKTLHWKSGNEAFQDTHGFYFQYFFFLYWVLLVVPNRLYKLFQITVVGVLIIDNQVFNQNLLWFRSYDDLY